jgi:hypothetical protein
MFKPSVTIHKDASGKLSVLACSEDSDVCVKAYTDCAEAGEIVYIRKGSVDKRKKIQGPIITTKKAAKKTAKKSVK